MTIPKDAITVVLAEDQGILRSSLAVMLGIEPDIRVLAAVSNGHEALRAVGQERPNVLVTDIEMPQLTGLDLAVRVKELYPATRVLILTTFARPGYLRRALDAGAVGYLLKDCPSTEMADAIRRVARGVRVVDPGLAADSWSADAGPLTERGERFCDVQAKVKAQQSWQGLFDSRREPFAIICPRLSRNLVLIIEPRRLGWREQKAGFNHTSAAMKR